MTEPDEDEIRQAKGENPNWLDLNKETIAWLIRTVQRLVPMDEQAVEEWNALVRDSHFHELTRHLGEEFQHEKMISELSELASMADIAPPDEGDTSGNDEEGC